MKVSLISRIVGWIGGSLMILLVMQATGLLDLVTNHTQGSGKPKDGVFTRTAPGSGPRWKELQERYAADIAIHDSEKGLQVVFYGDDLTESWRGSAAGGPCPACDGVPNVWGRHFGSLYRAQAYGIAGDQTANLLWRLRKGGRLRRHTPNVVVLQAGASDIDAAYATAGKAGAKRAAPGIAARMESIVKLLHGKRPEGRIIVLGLLPRVPLSPSAAAAAPGSAPHRAASLLDDSGGGATSALATQAKVEMVAAAESSVGPMFWPSRLGAGIAAVNARLERITEKYPAAHFVDCSPAFVVQHGTRTAEERRQRVIDPDLMPDGRQPNAEGMHRLGLCLDSLVNYLVTSPPPLDRSTPDEVDDTTPDKPNKHNGSFKEPKGAAAVGPADHPSGSAAAGAAVLEAAAADSVLAAAAQQGLASSDALDTAGASQAKGEKGAKGKQGTGEAAGVVSNKAASAAAATAQGVQAAVGAKAALASSAKVV